ncbi:MAG: hypothetical protein RMK29_11470 [Myxococcales bacterium]|nr:hypothetical protein [Myxococcota bacterium]MDW8282327.1 hypothetical protein [Myxococcales bacterium]
MNLTSWEQRWAAEVGAALLPPETLGGIRRELDLGAALGERIRRGGRALALGLRLALWLVWLAPLWRQGRPLTFGALSPAEREALLEALLDSPIYAVRELVMLLKMFFCLAFLGDVEVLRRLGCYDLAGPATPPVPLPGEHR